MIVVALGHRLVDDDAHPHLRDRVDAAIEVLRTADADALVLTGGRTTPGLESAECEAMAAYAADQGVQPERLRLEPRALDTIGNGYFTRLLIDELEEGIDELAVVTADYHAERARFVFDRCFGDHCRIVVDHGVETAVAPAQHEEARRLERTRAFFEPLEAGDVASIRRRLAADHDLYDEAAVAVEGRA